MAKYHNGYMGPFSGKLGPAVGVTWEGIPYLRSRPIRTSKATPAEKANRAKFNIAQQWLSPILPFVRVGFKGYTPTVEGFVAAKSYLMRNAMEGAGAESRVIPERMKVSYGDLPLSENITVQLSADRKSVEVRWNPIHIQGTKPRDQVMIMAYDTTNNYARFNTFGAQRLTGTDTLVLPARKETVSCHIYVAFVADDRSRQSMSMYLGEVNAGTTGK